MSIVDMDQRPHVELADLLPQIERGEEVVIHRDGAVVARLEPAHRPRFTRAMFDFRRAMHSPVYSGNSAVDMKQEERY